MKHRLLTTITIATCALLTAASSYSIAAVSAKPSPSIALADTTTVGKKSARDSSSLRCWQYGELLFEETHLAASSLSSNNNVITFENENDASERQLYLINTGSATCLYEKI